MYVFVVRRVRDRDAAEDLTSEVFHKALAHLPGFDWRGVPFSAWLIRIASNLVNDHWKRTAREVFRVSSPEGVIHHAQVRIGDSMIEIGEAHGQYQPMPTAIYLYVPDAAATYKRSLQAGATSLWEPAQMYGDLMAGITDPFGNDWYIATHRESP